MKRFMILAAIAMVVTTLPLTAASASADSGEIYLSLGDSVAAGTQNAAPFTDDGYTDVLFKRINGAMGLTEHVNLACPGDDTNEFIDGDDGPNGGSVCYGTAAPIPFGADSQLDAALAFLGAHEGEVGLITITIGANDLLGCDPVTPQCVGAALTTVSGNLTGTILPALTAAAPGVPIVAMNYYNPNLAYWLTPGGEAIAEQSNQLIATGNQVLAASYGAFGVPVVDVAGAFHTFDTDASPIPTNVRDTCRFTLMCEVTEGTWTLSAQPDIHPSDLGYKQIAWAFKKTLIAEGLLNR
jgi:lysophospholipase L1-like esterase